MCFCERNFMLLTIICYYAILVCISRKIAKYARIEIATACRPRNDVGSIMLTNVWRRQCKKCILLLKGFHVI